MADLKISQLEELEELSGEEMIPVQNGTTNNKVAASTLKKYVSDDISTELEGKMDKSGGEFTGSVGTPQISITRNSQGAMMGISSSANDIQFRTLNAGINSMSFNVQSATPLKITESGILENGVFLEDKYAKIDDIPSVPTDVSDFNNDAGYVTENDINEAVSAKQDSNDENLNTVSKNIVGAINELLASIGNIQAAIEQINNEKS